MKKKVSVDIEQLVDYLITRMRDIFVTKDDLKMEISHLPSKEEFFNSEAKLMKELKDMREEHTVQGEQVRRNTDRIENVEKKVGIFVT